jgi:hypothetical protein
MILIYYYVFNYIYYYNINYYYHYYLIFKNIVSKVKFYIVDYLSRTILSGRNPSNSFSLEITNVTVG